MSFCLISLGLACSLRLLIYTHGYMRMDIQDGGLYPQLPMEAEESKMLLRQRGQAMVRQAL